MTKIPIYDKKALLRLAERIHYERWLLSAVYEIAEQTIVSFRPDDVVYSIGGQKPHRTIYCGGIMTIGDDWRLKFLNAGAPLIFVSTFKLLDMLMEWVLEANGRKVDYKFRDKLQQLSQNPVFPTQIESHNWLKQRLLGLYKTLEPFRGTLIHNNQFISADSNLEITTTRSKLPKTNVSISAVQLKALAQLIVGTTYFIEASWKLGNYQQRILRYQLDNIQALHGEPKLLQEQPKHVSVRRYQLQYDNAMDLEKIQLDLAKIYPGYDVSFDLTLVLICNNKATAAFQFTWEIINLMSGIWDSKIDLQNYRISIPTDINFEHLKGK